MHQKKYSRYKPKEILAQKISISFHPDDNDKLTYEETYKIAEQFAQEFFWSKGYGILFAAHTDTDHIHAHFLVSNCNQKDETSFRRGPKELVEMSKYLGNQCMERGLSSSVRDSFYSSNKDREEMTFAEHQMKKRGKLSFKDEIKTYIRLVMNYESVKTVQDVVDMLGIIYGMDIRLMGKTISYALPYDLNKGGRTKAVRGGKLGKRFTVEGIEQYLQKNRVHLLPPPTDNTMEEFEKYKIRMGYNEKELKPVRYRMSVYDDFLKEYDYRKKVKGMQKTEQKQKTKKKRDYTR